MEKEIVQKKLKLKKMKKFLDENSIMYDRLFYDFNKGYCVVFSSNRYILGKIYKKAIYKIACLTSIKRLKLKCIYEDVQCFYQDENNACNLDFEEECIFEQAKENVN